MSMLIYNLDVDKNSIYTVIQKNRVMSKKCELTGKSPLKGHKVSHANNKTKRKFLPNLKKVTFVSNILKKNHFNLIYFHPRIEWWEILLSN